MSFLGGSKDNTQEKMRQWDNVDLPSIEDLQVQLEQMVYNGHMSPEQAQAYLAERVDFDNVQGNQQGRQAQQMALDSLMEMGQGDGFTDADRALMQRLQTQNNAQARGAREAIMQNMEARGAGGSGASLLAQLTAQQQQAQQQAQQGMDMAGMAQERALQALQAGGSMGSQMDQQRFAQQMAQQQAKQAQDQFNAANKTNVSQFNVGQNNAAQQFNLNKNFDQNQINTNIKNQQAMHNAQAPQQQFQNQATVAQGKTGVLTQQELTDAEKKKRQSGLVGGLISTAGGLIGG